jgi:hypothetical protein
MINKSKKLKIKQTKTTKNNENKNPFPLPEAKNEVKEIELMEDLSLNDHDEDMESNLQAESLANQFIPDCLLYDSSKKQSNQGDSDYVFNPLACDDNLDDFDISDDRNQIGAVHSLTSNGYSNYNNFNSDLNKFSEHMDMEYQQIEDQN